jgi:mRNA-degrading endonuclease RelE of RelBE toxin-antitoxin system
MRFKYKPSFLRALKKLPPEVQREAREKLEQFADPANHERLRVHKLKGRMKNYYSFSVTYSHRVVFEYDGSDKNTVVLMVIGNHDVYN